MIHEMRLHEGPFKRILSGEQQIESRLFDAKRRILHIGDTIVFTNRTSPEKQIHTTITGLLHYPTFNEMFADLHAKYFPQYKRSELEDCMLAYYSEEEEKKRGVIGIRIALL